MWLISKVLLLRWIALILTSFIILYLLIWLLRHPILLERHLIHHTFLHLLKLHPLLKHLKIIWHILRILTQLVPRLLHKLRKLIKLFHVLVHWLLLHLILIIRIILVIHQFSLFKFKCDYRIIILNKNIIKLNSILNQINIIKTF